MDSEDALIVKPVCGHLVVHVGTPIANFGAQADRTKFSDQDKIIKCFMAQASFQTCMNLYTAKSSAPKLATGLHVIDHPCRL